MALYAFDGTWDRPEVLPSLVRRTERLHEPAAPRESSNTNVVLFRRHYDDQWETGNDVLAEHATDRDSFYVDGVGSRFGLPGRGLGGVFGLGGKRRVRKMYRYLCRRYRTDTTIDIVGFSRGAATAVHFTNLLDQWGICDIERPLLFPRWSRYLGWHRFRRVENAEFPKVRFVGLFDEVASFLLPFWKLRNFSPTWQVQSIPQSVTRCFHAIAMDEVRRSFELVDPEIVDSEATAKYSVWFRGVHRNIGGGHLDRGLSDITLIWMLEMFVYTVRRDGDDAPTSILALLERLDAHVLPHSQLVSGEVELQPSPDGFIPRMITTKRDAWRDMNLDGKAPLVHHSALQRTGNNPADHWGDNQALLRRIPSSREIVYDPPLLPRITREQRAVADARSAFRSIVVRPRQWLMLDGYYVFRSDHLIGIGPLGSRYQKEKPAYRIATRAFLDVISTWLLDGRSDQASFAAGLTLRTGAVPGQGVSYEQSAPLSPADKEKTITYSLRIFHSLEGLGLASSDIE